METTIMGLYWDNGKENGNHYNGLYWDHMSFSGMKAFCLNQGSEIH